MEKKAFLVQAVRPVAIGEYTPLLVVLAKDRDGALKALKDYGHGIHVGYGDSITYSWAHTISVTDCQLIELPLLETEKVLV